MGKIDWLEVIRVILQVACQIIEDLGDKGRIEKVSTEKGERQCRAELVIWRTSQGLLDKFDLPIRFEAEDHDPENLVEHPDFLWRMDLIDGTTGYVRQQRSLYEPAMPVVAVTPIKECLVFEDVIASGAIDPRSGEYWLAEKERGAFKGIGRGKMERFWKVRQYHLHTPVHTTDPWRRVNGLTRFLWPQCHEVWNSGSVAMDMILVALGEADLFYNGLPMISPEGQRGHELGACYRILKEAGGYAMDMRTGQELGKSLFLFDEQTPVVMGVNEAKVRLFWRKIQENFDKVGYLLKEAWNLIELERWSLG